MAAKPERAPGVPGRSGAPLQRQQDAAVPEVWLDDAGHDHLADGVDRLAGDVDLVTSLALAGYMGELWDYFANELAKYGYAVTKSWIAQKLIFEKCKTKGFGLWVLDRDFTQDEIEGLANETVAKALFHFRRDVLMKRRWDPTKGASIRTFFVGQCLFRFPNIYRAWLDQLRDERRHDFTDDIAELDFQAERTIAVDRHVIASIAASEAMDHVKDPRVRKAMLMTAHGFPQAEIARVLGVTEKAVERMLANERSRLRRKGAG